ncbi:hypothetical protein JG687_00015735, partial [Phytophthora cactorum]
IDDTYQSSIESRSYLKSGREWHKHRPGRTTSGTSRPAPGTAAARDTASRGHLRRQTSVSEALRCSTMCGGGGGRGAVRSSGLQASSRTRGTDRFGLEEGTTAKRGQTTYLVSWPS